MPVQGCAGAMSSESGPPLPPPFKPPRANPPPHPCPTNPSLHPAPPSAPPANPSKELPSDALRDLPDSGPRGGGSSGSLVGGLGPDAKANVPDPAKTSSSGAPEISGSFGSTVTDDGVIVPYEGWGGEGGARPYR